MAYLLCGVKGGVGAEHAEKILYHDAHDSEQSNYRRAFAYIRMRIAGKRLRVKGLPHEKERLTFEFKQ